MSKPNDSEEFIRNNCKCCITGKPLTDSKFLNIIELSMAATWEYPVLIDYITGCGPMAVAYVHDSAFIKGKPIGPVKYAVEIDGEKIIYHPIRRCRVCGCTDDDCNQCIKKTGHPCHWVEEDLCSACK